MSILSDIEDAAVSTVKQAYDNATMAGKVAIGDLILAEVSWKHRRPDAYALICSIAAFGVGGVLVHMFGL